MVALSDGLGLTAGGFINSLGGGLTASLFNRLADPCSLGGCDFYIIDSREQMGRRIHRQLFPGADTDSQVFQDFGNMDTPIHITGLIYGNDYVARARRMSEVLQKEGALILLHPWWGRLRVRLAEPATLSFRHDQVRIATFEANLLRDELPIPQMGFFANIASSLDHLLKMASALADAARNAVGIALSVAAIPLAVASAVRSAISIAKGVFDAITKTVPGALKNALGESRQHDKNTLDEDSVSDSLNSDPSAIGACLPNQEQPITAPAADAPAPAQNDVTAAQIGDILVNAATEISKKALRESQVSTDAGTTLFLSVVAQSFCAVQLTAAWGGLSFTSNADCQVVFDKYSTVLDGILSDIERAQEAGAKAPLSGIFEAISDLKNALSVDASHRIGRLPGIMSVSVPGRVSLFLLANALAGDTPAKLMESFGDLRSRNQIAHPALALGTLEALDG